MVRWWLRRHRVTIYKTTRISSPNAGHDIGLYYWPCSGLSITPSSTSLSSWRLNSCGWKGHRCCIHSAFQISLFRLKIHQDFRHLVTKETRARPVHISKVNTEVKDLYYSWMHQWNLLKTYHCLWGIKRMESKFIQYWCYYSSDEWTHLHFNDIKEVKPLKRLCLSNEKLKFWFLNVYFGYSRPQKSFHTCKSILIIHLSGLLSNIV